MSSGGALERLESANDRLLEAHFFLHGLEEYYHFASPFRWHLNAFLRPLKEVPELVANAIQNDRDLVEWHHSSRAELNHDPLICHLHSQRDFIVHQGMLLPTSHVSFGLTEGRGMKLGLGIPPLSPKIDSDTAMERIGESLRKAGDLLGILAIDDEDSLPAIERRWALTSFPENELLDLCAEAWLKTAKYFGSVLQQVDCAVTPPSLDCRHGSNAVRIRAYDRSALRKGVVRPVLLSQRR